jgi:hypothetical protein
LADEVADFAMVVDDENVRGIKHAFRYRKCRGTPHNESVSLCIKPRF